MPAATSPLLDFTMDCIHCMVADAQCVNAGYMVCRRWMNRTARFVTRHVR
jgi:hypothetical protein